MYSDLLVRQANLGGWLGEQNKHPGFLHHNWQLHRTQYVKLF